MSNNESVNTSQFGISMLNDAYKVLSSIEGKRASVADIIAAADAQARLAQAAGLCAMAEAIGGLTQVIANQPPVSSDGLLYALNKVFGEQDNETFISIKPCYTQGVAHLAHRWTHDHRNFHYCEGITSYQASKLDEGSESA